MRLVVQEGGACPGLAQHLAGRFVQLAGGHADRCHLPRPGQDPRDDPAGLAHRVELCVCLDVHHAHYYIPVGAV
ncbi:hypothetical protein SBADM41S_08345 [Streptomyces badius]